MKSIFTVIALCILTANSAFGGEFKMTCFDATQAGTVVVTVNYTDNTTNPPTAKTKTYTTGK